MQTHDDDDLSGAGGALRALAETPRGAWAASWAAILSRDVPFGGLQVAMYQQFHACFAHWCEHI